MANQYERMRPPTDRRGNKILSEFQQNVKLQKNPEMVSKKQFFIYITVVIPCKVMWGFQSDPFSRSNEVNLYSKYNI